MGPKLINSMDNTSKYSHIRCVTSFHLSRLTVLSRMAKKLQSAFPPGQLKCVQLLLYMHRSTFAIIAMIFPNNFILCFHEFYILNSLAYCQGYNFTDTMYTQTCYEML